MRLAISFLRTHKLLSSGEAGGLPQAGADSSLINVSPHRRLCCARVRRLLERSPHPGTLTLQNFHPQKLSLVLYSFMLHIFTVVSFMMNTAKGKDRTKEAPGHLAAEERRSWENGAALATLPVAAPPGCKTHTPPQTESLGSVLVLTFQLPLQKGRGVPMQSFRSY